MINMLIPSIMSINNNRERGNPCLSPEKLQKKIIGEPLIRIAKLAEVTQTIKQSKPD